MPHPNTIYNCEQALRSLASCDRARASRRVAQAGEGRTGSLSRGDGGLRFPHRSVANKIKGRGNPMALLQNHIAVVTGAGSGIGRAIAAGYAREGARVVLLDINEKAANEAAQEIRNSGGSAT